MMSFFMQLAFAGSFLFIQICLLMKYIDLMFRPNVNGTWLAKLGAKQRQVPPWLGVINRILVRTLLGTLRSSSKYLRTTHEGQLQT